jgi:hypothetical protein
MRISEQIDALESMAVSPVQYLVVPRVIAGTIMTPLLTMFFFFVGMVGAYIVAVYVENVDPGIFLENFRWTVDPKDLMQGLIRRSCSGPRSPPSAATRATTHRAAGAAWGWRRPARSSSDRLQSSSSTIS